VIIAIGLYQGFTALDAIGPYEVLTYLPNAEVVICAEQKGLVDDHNDLVHLRVDTTFADVPRPDVLFVPGGPDHRLDTPGPPAHRVDNLGMHRRTTARRRRAA